MFNKVEKKRGYLRNCCKAPDFNFQDDGQSTQERNFLVYLENIENIWILSNEIFFVIC